MVIFIGVDPAYRKNGFYVCTIWGNLVEFIKMPTYIDYVKFIDLCSESGEEVWICIENSNETNHTFVSKSVKSASAREKVSRDVGKNQAISQMSVDYAEHRIKFGKVFSVSPAQKGVKWNNKIFEQSVIELKLGLVNYKGLKSEQDKRDAYKLALRAKYEYYASLNKKK